MRVLSIVLRPGADLAKRESSALDRIDRALDRATAVADRLKDQHR